MFNISSYLKRMSVVLDTSALNTSAIADIIKKHTGISKDKDFFEIKEGILRTNLSPAEKMMLFMKKEAIIHDLTPFHIKDIR